MGRVVLQNVILAVWAAVMEESTMWFTVWSATIISLRGDLLYLPVFVVFRMLFVYVNKDILGVLMLEIWLKDLDYTTKPHINV